MDCRNFEELSQLYIDAELDDERISQFEAHLLACNGCKREMEYLQATLHGIESYPQLEPPSDLADNVMERIEGVRIVAGFLSRTSIHHKCIKATCQQTIDKISPKRSLQ